MQQPKRGSLHLRELALPNGLVRGKGSRAGTGHPESGNRHRARDPCRALILTRSPADWLMHALSRASGNRKPETGNRKPESGNQKPETATALATRASLSS
jgi:hypothetical protein